MSYYMQGGWLCHHGIIGQKWGVRRFQNEDGTLTEAGKSRYGSVERVGRKKLMKQIKKHDRNPNNKSRKFAEEAMSKAYKQADESDTGKDYNQLFEKFLSEGELDQKEGERFFELADRYETMVNDYINAQRSDYFGVLLSELGYDDTESGRKYIESMLN